MYKKLRNDGSEFVLELDDCYNYVNSVTVPKEMNDRPDRPLIDGKLVEYSFV